jgi:hypothetical protein
VSEGNARDRRESDPELLQVLLDAAFLAAIVRARPWSEDALQDDESLTDE